MTFRRTRSFLPISAVALVLLALSALAAEVPDPLPDRDGNPADMSKRLKVYILAEVAETLGGVRIQPKESV